MPKSLNQAVVCGFYMGVLVLILVVGGLSAEATPGLRLQETLCVEGGLQARESKVAIKRVILP